MTVLAQKEEIESVIVNKMRRAMNEALCEWKKHMNEHRLQ